MEKVHCTSAVWCSFSMIVGEVGGREAAGFTGDVQERSR
jgi:hypothetical protein